MKQLSIIVLAALLVALFAPVAQAQSGCWGDTFAASGGRMGYRLNINQWEDESCSATFSVTTGQITSWVGTVISPQPVPPSRFTAAISYNSAPLFETYLNFSASASYPTTGGTLEIEAQNLLPGIGQGWSGSIVVYITLGGGAGGDCNPFSRSTPTGMELVLEATNVSGGCEAFLGHNDLAYLGATLEVFSRPGQQSIHGNIGFRTMRDEVVEIRLVGPPTANNNQAALTKPGNNVRLQLVLPDGAGTFSARLTVKLGTIPPTPTPTSGGNGVCEPGDFYCSYSGKGYVETFERTFKSGDTVGFNTWDFPLSSHVAEPGAWNFRLSGCGSRQGNGQGLSALLWTDGFGERIFYESGALTGAVQASLANEGVTIHIPVPTDPDVYGSDSSRMLYLRLNSGSAWPAGEGQTCHVSMVKLANNNFKNNTLTAYLARRAWDTTSLGVSAPLHDFAPAAAAGSVAVSVEYDMAWPGHTAIRSISCAPRINGAGSVAWAASEVKNLTLVAGETPRCVDTAANNRTQAKVTIAFGPYVAGPTNTPTPSRTPTVSPTPSSTRTLAPAYTRTPTQPSATRTTTLTPTETSTASPTITGTRPVEVPCAISVTHEIPVTPGTITIRLEIGMRFVLADNPIFVNYGSQAIEINPGSYEWQQATADYVLYSITEPARLAVCIGDSATPTWTASRTITQIAGNEDEYCFPATPIPIDDVNPMLPDLALIMPTWTPTVMISITTTAMTTTIAISVTAVIGLISTVETGIISPAARIQTAVAPYSWESGETTGASWAARLDPVLQWLAILNPDNPAWSAAGGPLWALSPVLIYLLPIVIVLLAVALLQFVLWLARLLLAALQLIMQVIETITP